MIIFHRFLIATAILFCVTVSAWALNAFLTVGGATYVSLGVGFGIAALALGYYLKNLKLFLHR